MKPSGVRTRIESQTGLNVYKLGYIVKGLEPAADCLFLYILSGGSLSMGEETDMLLK